MYMSGWIQANQRSSVHLPQTKLGRENWQSYQLISFPVDGYCVDTISDPFACSNKKGKKTQYTCKEQLWDCILIETVGTE